MLSKSDFVKLFHFIAIIQFFYGIYYEWIHVLPKELKLRKFSFGGKWIYLTFLNGIVQACYHLLAFTHDIIGVNKINLKYSSAIRRARGYIYASFAFPLAMNVTTVFWGLYSIDRELVFPSVMDLIYPSWLNHILHTNVFIFIVIELFIYQPQYPARKVGLIGLAVFSIGYILWVHVVKIVTNAWVYPVLNILNISQRITFFVVVGIIPLLLYFVGEHLNKIILSKQKLVQKKT